MIRFDLKSEKRLRAINSHLQFFLRTVIFELSRKAAIRSRKNAFQRFSAKSNAPPFGALHVNPVPVGCVHTITHTVTLSLGFLKRSELAECLFVQCRFKFFGASATLDFLHPL